MSTEQRYMRTLYKSYMLPPDKIPLLVSNTILAGYFFGDDGLAIVSFLMPIYFLFETVGYWINYGAFTKTIDAISKNESTRAREYSSLALSLSVISSVSLSSVVSVAFPNLLGLLSVPTDLQRAATEYGLPMVLSCAVMMIALYCWQFVKIIGLQARIRKIYVPIMLVDVLTVILCVKVFELGIVALAIGMLAANLFTIAMSGMWLRASFRHNLFARVETPIRDAVEIIAAGSAPAMGKFYSFFVVVFFNAVLMRAFGVHGVAAFAALQTAIRICRLHSQVTWQPLAPILAMELGDRNIPSATLLVKHALRQAIIMAVLPAVVIFFGAEYFTSSLDSSIQGFAVDAFKVYSLSVVPAAISSIFIIAYSVVNRRALANILEFIRSLVLIVVFVQLTEPSMLFRSYVFAEIVTLILILAIHRASKLPAARSALFMVVDRRVGLTDEDSARLENVLPRRTVRFVEDWLRLTKEFSDVGANDLTAIHVVEGAGGLRLTLRSMGKLFDYRTEPRAMELLDELPGRVESKITFTLGLNNLYLRF